MWKISTILKNRKLVLGRNERYLTFIRPNNLRRAIKIADDKVLTKKILKQHSIPVPAKIKVIKNTRELNTLDFSTLPKSFVIKPVKGVRGSGVEIFYNKDTSNNWIKADRSRLSIKDLQVLMRDILDGKYSLFNEPDRVLIEERVKPYKNFKYYAYRGAPDIRVLVYNKIPVMSYVRLPTRESDGKANLDRGAIAAGIDMAVGKTTNAIIGKSTEIEYVPETNLPLSGLRIPYWDKILRYAVEASKVTGLGFAAVDFLIDSEKGPMIVELNARPGLSIQLANADGLRWRLKKAGGIKIKSTDHAIRLAKDLFGGEIEEEIEHISGKQVIGTIEKVKLHKLNAPENAPKSEQEIRLLAKIDTGAEKTSIDEQVAIELGYGDAINYFKSFNYPVFAKYEDAKKVSSERDLLIESGQIQEHPHIKSRSLVKSATGVTIRPIIPIKLEISGIILETSATVADRSDLNYKVIVGLKDLRSFLIDTSKNKSNKSLSINSINNYAQNSNSTGS